MKKLLVIPILLLYIIATSGISVSLHFCGDDVASWALTGKASGCEDASCDMAAPSEDNCCKDKIIKVNVDDEQVIVKALQWDNNQLLFVTPTIFHGVLNNVVYQGYQPSVAHAANAPPGLWQSIPLYKLFSSFAYYG